MAVQQEPQQMAEMVARLKMMDKRILLPYASTTMDDLQIVTGTAL